MRLRFCHYRKVKLLLCSNHRSQKIQNTKFHVKSCARTHVCCKRFKHINNCCRYKMLVARFVQVYSVSQRYFSSSRDSLHAAYVNRGASELDLSRKSRRKDHLRGRFKLPNAVALTTSREPSHLHGPASTNHLNSNSSCNGTET